MPKSRSRRDANLRRHIAYLAARLIAEDGVGDYATAKQKAARQAGLERKFLYKLLERAGLRSKPAGKGDDVEEDD